MEKYISPNSPKNAYSAEIYSTKALTGIGANTQSVGAMTLEECRSRAEAICASILSRGVATRLEITISHNVAGYPSFSWQEVEHYVFGEQRGGARPGAGRKAKADARVVLSARVKPATLDALRREAAAAGIGLGAYLDNLCKSAKLS